MENGYQGPGGFQTKKMANYLISLSHDRMEKQAIPFEIHYENGDAIDFNQEGIGVISSLELKEIPHFIEKALEETGLHKEYSGFSFGPVIDEGKVWVEEGAVELYILDTKTTLTRKEFFETILQLAQKALEAVSEFHLKEKDFVDEVWIEQVKKMIPQLEAKLKSNL